MAKVPIAYKAPDKANLEKPDILKLRQLIAVTSDDSYKVADNSYISTEVLDILKDAYALTHDLSSYFIKSDKTRPHMSYYVDTQCDKCKKSTLRSLNKSELFEYIISRSYVCENCKKHLKKVEEDTSIKNTDDRRGILIANTEEYINSYLNPDKRWIDELSIEEKYNSINNVYVDWAVISEYINTTLSYEEFLSTPYWKAIAEKTKKQAGYRCQLCASQDHLVTHHKTYENHGREHEYFIMKNDLIVLCENCHNKFHDILPNREEV